MNYKAPKGTFKITKRNFELHLFKLNGEEQIYHNLHTEYGDEEGTYNLVHLYYNDNGHCGTWTKGKGFVFKDRFLPHKWAVFNHNHTLLGTFPTKLKAEKAARDYTYMTENAATVEEIAA